MFWGTRGLSGSRVLQGLRKRPAGSLPQRRSGVLGRDSGEAHRGQSPCNAEFVTMSSRNTYAHSPPVDYLTPHRSRVPSGAVRRSVLFPALERAWLEDKNPAWREHVTPYLYKTSGLFTVKRVGGEGGYSHMRWTVDTPEDLEFIRKVYSHFGRHDFSWREVIELLTDIPTGLT